MKILIYLDIKLKLCHRKEKSLKSIIKNIYIRKTDRIRTHDPTITRMTLLLIPAPSSMAAEIRANIILHLT